MTEQLHFTLLHIGLKELDHDLFYHVDYNPSKTKKIHQAFICASVLLFSFVAVVLCMHITPHFYAREEIKPILKEINLEYSVEGRC